MITKSKELCNICKKKTYKRLLKVAGVPILLILFVLLSFVIYCSINKYLLWVYIFGGGIIVVITSFAAMIPLFTKIPFKEICVENMNIGVFVEPSIGIGNKFVIIHLIVDDKEYVKQVNLEYYHHAPSNSLIGIAINVSELIRYSNDYKKDKKQKTYIAKFTKTVKNKSISVIYNKYNKKIAIFLDSKLCD